MREITIHPSTLKGTIRIPPSKSHTLRAILFASLGKGLSVISRYLKSKDTDAMIQGCRQLGARIEVKDNELRIEGTNGKMTPPISPINAGNSGIVYRFCTGLSAIMDSPIVVTGDESIRKNRPIQPLLSALNQLEASASSVNNDGCAPIRVQGPIKPGIVRMNGADSQPVSALLIAAAFASGPIEIHVENPGETPWIALTLSWFDQLNIPYKNDDFKRYQLFGMTSFKGFEYEVPGDFSSGAFPIAAALITGSRLTLENLNMQDIQGDKAIIRVFQQMGANIEIGFNFIQVHPTKKLQGLSIDINDFIDALPILATVGCYAEGETVIYNAAIAKKKECDRIACISNELKKMGADIEATEDGLRIKKSPLKGAIVYSHQDHRIAMALSVAALQAIGKTTLTAAECVDKTFPSFFSDFAALGAAIQ